jgi:hypothetical protein
MYIDNFGNVQRYFARYMPWKHALDKVYYHPEVGKRVAEKAFEFIKARGWADSAKLVLAATEKKRGL